MVGVSEEELNKLQDDADRREKQLKHQVMRVVVDVDVSSPSFLLSSFHSSVHLSMLPSFLKIAIAGTALVAVFVVVPCLPRSPGVHSLPTVPSLGALWSVMKGLTWLDLTCLDLAWFGLA